ncbi:MAG: hypothetical protein EXR77_20460 [Myxococcales bacterium]|nr:hypothetical protein [Myxococcales bacterium]
MLVNTAVGSPAHDLPLPAGEVTTILNGDGYLQRFDFAGDATAVLTTRLAKTLSYWALHVAHSAATDVAEWVRPYDRQT